MQPMKFLISFGGKDVKFIKKYIEDMLVLSGLTIIVIATFLLSTIAGLYCLGGSLFGLGIYFTRYPFKKE